MKSVFCADLKFFLSSSDRYVALNRQNMHVESMTRRKGDYTLRPCLNCGTLFTPANRRPHQKYCSHACAMKAWVKNNREKQREISYRWKKRNPESCRKAALRYATKNKEKRHARRLAYYRIPLGERCEMCGASETSGRLMRHHPDYSKPLEVMTVCYPCNYKAPHN